LLTGKEKRILRNLARNSSSCEEEFNSNDQEEMDDSSPSKSCKGNSSVPQSMNTSPEHSYSAPVPRRSLVAKNLENNEKGFQFSKKTSSFQKQPLQSISTQSFAANDRMKNCQDAIDYLNVPDTVNVLVNELETLRNQFATMNEHFRPISPPKIIVSKYNQPSKDLTAINPCTASVSSNQSSVTSNNQILQVTKAPSSSTPRKRKFCRQQSEGFEIPSGQLYYASNLNPEDSKNGALNVTSSDSPNYINLNAERVDNGLSLKFDVPSQLHLGIDLNKTNVRSQIQSFENQVEHSRSSSSESLLPLKKKLKISESPQQYEKSPLENVVRLSNFALETTKTSHNVHMDQTDVQLKCNSEQKASDSFNALNSPSNETLSSISNCTDDYVTELTTERDYANGENETMSEINRENETMSEMDRDQDFLRRSASDRISAEVEMKTEGISSRSSKKGQNFILRETELKKDLIGDQSASVNDDSKYLTDQISEIESDYEFPLVIADVEVSHSSNDSEIENSAKIAKNSARESNLYVASSEIKNDNPMYPEKNYNMLSELPEIIQSVFQAVEVQKIKSSNTRFKACVHNLVSVLTDPTNVENCQMLIYYLVMHLHRTKRNPMRYFSRGNNRDILLPLTENCFVTALFHINQKNKPHLAKLITCTVSTLCRLILVKTEYHIYGLSSLCRVLTAICKQLNDSKKIKLLCYHLFMHDHKYTPFLIATIVAVWPEAFAVSSDSPGWGITSVVFVYCNALAFIQTNRCASIL
ncbi:uncharacterized protein TNCV_2362101, partial [Trichonephila clavipes]